MKEYYIFSKRSGGPLCTDEGNAIFFKSIDEVHEFLERNVLNHNEYEIHYGFLFYEFGQIYYKNIQEEGVIV